MTTQIKGQDLKKNTHTQKQLNIMKALFTNTHKIPYMLFCSY
jgi:hypothetical protein